MELNLINKNNEVLDLLNNQHRFILTAAEAMHGVDTDISESETPYTDGTEVTNVKALPRSIELTFALVGDVQESIKFFTSYVKSKQYVTLVENDGEREITIKGVATIPPYTRMADLCKITLTIYCNKPYWQDLNEAVNIISQYISLLYFPEAGQYFTADGRPFGVIDTSYTKTINNDGDTSTGLNIKITALQDVSNPRISCSTGEQNGYYMQLNVNLKSGDIVEISTIKNNKYILINGSDTYNGNPTISYLEFNGNDWLQLEEGENTFNISPEDDSIYFSLNYRRLYE